MKTVVDRMTDYLFPPPPSLSLPVRGMAKRFPINRLFFVGRNYHAHSNEMGKPVDKSLERPFYFTKTPQTLVQSGATIPYPSETHNFHFEMEMVVAIGAHGFRVEPTQAHDIVYGYAAGLDMTRRDLQLVARDKGRPWDLGKDVEHSSVCSEIVPLQGHIVDNGAIELEVNGVSKQSSNVDKLIWDVVSGDKITGRVAGVAGIELTIG